MWRTGGQTYQRTYVRTRICGIIVPSYNFIKSPGQILPKLALFHVIFITMVTENGKSMENCFPRLALPICQFAHGEFQVLLANWYFLPISPMANCYIINRSKYLVSLEDGMEEDGFISCWYFEHVLSYPS